VAGSCLLASGLRAQTPRIGGTGASGAVGESYAATRNLGGGLSLAAISMLPHRVEPFPVQLKAANARFFKGKTRIVIPSYALMVNRSGRVTAFAGGRGSESNMRRTSLSTALVGVPDDLAAKLADEAYKDLVKRLTDAGYEVLPQETVAASAIGQIRTLGPVAKTTYNGQQAYGPPGLPLKPGAPFLFSNMNDYAKGAEDLGAIVLLPALGVDYERLETSGAHAYSSSASVNARLRFHAVQASGATFMVTPDKPYRGGWAGTFLMPQGAGTDEAFGIMYEVDDRSDSKALSNAFALAGFGSMYRQSKVYAVEVDPGRFTAMTRAAYEGLNAAIVTEMKKASEH
jgi:hypothetical protein